MVQPKTPPLSIRVPAELLALIDAMAERRKIKRHAAILLALQIGEATDRGFDPKFMERVRDGVDAIKAKGPEGGVTYVAQARQSEPMRMPRAPIGSLLDKKAGKAKR